MSLSARLRLDREFTISPVDDRLYGGFAEHLGRHIYTGIYEPGHPTADANGFRKDVIDLVKGLNLSLVRYPGGNFVSGYNWQDGVGPKKDRPRRLELAWGVTETNEFGTNEFIDWCRAVGTEPMLAVNLGTRDGDEARNLVEYCNHPGGSALSDQRRAHGYAKPHGVKYWCLGNEMDGPWQMGHVDAKTYGQRARQAAAMMRTVDGSIETVLVGSSGSGMPTFGKWEWESLHEAYSAVDYLSIHTYLGNTENDTAQFLAKTDRFGTYIDDAVALCDAVGASLKSKKKINISYDEWNVWYHSHGEKIEPWSVAPAQLEDQYTMEDALVVGGMLIEMINRCDRVKIACIAQIVNVIGPIMTAPGGPAWRQTIYYPFQHASQLGRGTALRPVVETPSYGYNLSEGGKAEASVLSCAAVHGPEGLTVFALNRSLDSALNLKLDVTGFDIKSATWHVLQDKDLKSLNTKDEPDRIKPRSSTATGPEFELAPASWNVLHFKL